MTLEQINVGLVGAAGRGGAFADVLRANGARVLAVCDVRKDALQWCADRTGAEQTYTDYQEMLERADLDAVVIGTPMPLHAPQSIAALRRGIHVLSEVPAAVSIQECKDLVSACRDSRAVYMMAENYIYTRPNVLVTALVRAGLFGTPYYAEGEYLHELKAMNEQTPWRRKWQTGIDGITYPTHSLGPILEWMKPDRIERVACEGSGRHYMDPRGEPYHQETAVMLCKMKSGGLVKVRLDMVSDRPHAMSNYQLQGTDGVYESSRGGPGERDKIWLRALSEEPRWFDLECLAEQYLPEMWRNPPPEALRAGHGGGDFFVVRDFLRAVRGEAPPAIGIHEALDMTLPGLLSQQSIREGSRWLPVPDSRNWTEPSADRPQLQMLWPERLLDRPPSVSLPEGYELRTFTEADTEAYLELIRRAGFEDWTRERLQQVLRTVLPGGLILAVHRPTGRLAATAMAQHNPDPLHPFGGELGWVAADPDHRGKGLGRAVCAAAVDRLIRAGYRRIYLRTDDCRLAAIRTYLKLGFEPFLYSEGMAEGWQAVMRKMERHRR